MSRASTPTASSVRASVRGAAAARAARPEGTPKVSAPGGTSVRSAARSAASPQAAVTPDIRLVTETGTYLVTETGNVLLIDRT